MSLRLQNEGQKKTHGLHRCTRSLWHGFFWPLFFSVQRDYKRICKRYRLRLLWCSDCPVIYCYLVYILSLWEQVPPTCKIRQIRAISVRKKTFAYIKLNTNIPNQTNHLICRQNQRKIRLKSHLSCQGTIRIKRKSKFKSKRKIKKRIREKTPLHLW